MVPAERAVMLLSVSRAMSKAIKRVRPAARVMAKRGQAIERVEGGLPTMSQWLLVTGGGSVAPRHTKVTNPTYNKNKRHRLEPIKSQPSWMVNQPERQR